MECVGGRGGTGHDRRVRSPAVFFSIVLALGACSSSTATPAPTDPMPESPPEPAPEPGAVDWAGPPFTCAVEAVGGERWIRVGVTVPSGGWELGLEGTSVDGSDVTVLLKLVRPAADELTTQALVTHGESVLAPIASGRVLLRVAEWQRGVQYLVPPQARLASVTPF